MNKTMFPSDPTYVAWMEQASTLLTTHPSRSQIKGRIPHTSKEALADEILEALTITYFFGNTPQEAVDKVISCLLEIAYDREMKDLGFPQTKTIH